MQPKRIRAHERPGARAVLRDLRPLSFSEGMDPAADVPAQVRAASAVRAWGGRLAVVQDDTNVLALLGPAGEIEPLLLPWGEGGRRRFEESLGNKPAKLDLEAGLVLPDGRLIALGSGSTARRERIALAWPDGRAELRECGAFYRALRDAADFAGSELNLEGAIAPGDRLRLFQRGNGAPGEGRPAINATADFDLADWVRWLDGAGPLPPMLDIVQYDLGSLAGVPLGFTDAAALPSGAVAFLACAEASPDAVRDGEVLGCRIGLIDGEDCFACDVRDTAARAVRLKLEGLEPLAWGETLRFVAVADMDRPDTPALVGELELIPG